VLIGVHLWFLPAAAAQEADQEIVANLAAGRVFIYPAKEGLVIGALERRVEADARTPMIVQVGRRRAAVLLGAAEWVLTAGETVRLDREMPQLMAGVAGRLAGPGRLQEQASDIEELGLALLERLRGVAGQLHHKIPLAPEEHILEVLLAGYADEYGFEVWSLRYRIVQEPLRGDYWRTRVLRPSYAQLYPPEKGQPRTLIEAHYPPENTGERLLDSLRNDPRVLPLRAQTRFARAAEQLERGESHKAKLDEAVDLVRAVMGALAPEEAGQALAIVREREGFDWVLPPREPVPRADEKKADEARPPGAPTLRRPPQ
jgi:hypothetical protein